MESILPLGGFQLPFQKRLSNLYNDTKKSSDFVKEPVRNEEDPETKALHRKLRIQKDRLVSWGLEWAEPNQSAEIDESLSKAGLSEVVGSIMSTIKDILAEAEPLWLSSKQIVEGPRPSPDFKAPLVQWDKARFEDLVRDLTTSIDTLYDVSRTRSAGMLHQRSSKSPYKTSSHTEEPERPFESTRIQTPQQIDPQTLTHVRPARSYEGGVPGREVVFMSKTAYSELTQGTTREPWAPLLLEYATYDTIYSATGIVPPMARFEKISAGLQQDPQRAPGAWTGLPRLLGYFEDIENSRLGLVYRFPQSFNAILFERVTKNALYDMPTLNDLLSQPGSEPQLEAKFRLAYNLANTVFDMHARGITHGNLSDRNVSFCHSPSQGVGASHPEIDVRRPLVSSFDIFLEDSSVPSNHLSRHPLDPRTTTKSPLSKYTDERVLELYSLAMVMLSIGLWTSLDKLAGDANAKVVPESILRHLSIRCGSLYARAVQACWTAVDAEISGKGQGEALLSSVQTRATRFLEACCILDGVSGFEERLNSELHETESTRRDVAPVTSRGDAKGVKPQSARAGDTKPAIVRPEPVAPADPVGTDRIEVTAELPKSDVKIRLYPHVPLSPEAVEKWNTILMPQINQALRHFYRKHPESVEISLESVGPSPDRTQPTVLVVCTSVGKVRAILKKRVGELFDGTTGFSLKVCRGHVVRSRRQAKSFKNSAASKISSPDVVKRSAADDDDEIEAVNPEYQIQPGNGASIGAWIGDRHLPPVSFGGLVLVDDKPYGMTVHHMLDDPDRDFSNDDTLRSSGIPGRDWYAESTVGSAPDDDSAYELSDTESEPYSETDITSDFGDEDESEGEYEEPGDMPGIEPGCGDGYIVTQPALDDVEDGFYPNLDTQDEDHLDSYSLGEVYASSGLRRKQSNGLVHEVDWALFEFDSQRLPKDNTIPRAHDVTAPPPSDVHLDNAHSFVRPTAVASSTSLPGREVQCVARTSGLQTGQILPALTSVKIYGRTSPSHTYQVANVPPTKKADTETTSVIPMGIPGDSGAWIVDRAGGQLCGHVLAWSTRKQVAYICPMDVLLQDIGQTLGAADVRLPGAMAAVYKLSEHGLLAAKPRGKLPSREESEDEDEEDEEDEDEEDVVNPEITLNMRRTHNAPSRSESISSRRVSDPSASKSPVNRLETPGEMHRMGSGLEMGLPGGSRIGVNG